MSVRNNRCRILAMACLAAGVLTARNVVCAQIPGGGYEVTAIVSMEKCPPFGVPPVVPLGINEEGWMVGFFQPCVIGPDRAFLWTPDDGLVVIPTPAGTTYSRAVAISGSRIVGEFDNSNELGRTGFLYDLESDQFTSLGTLPGGNWSQARAINSEGKIVGFWGDVVKGPSPLAFIWRDGEMIDIHPDFGTRNSDADDINENGLVTGWMGTSILTDASAFLWEDGKVTSLGPIPGGFTSEGRAINAMRQIVGRGKIERDGQTLIRVFLWGNKRFTDLGMLPGFDRCAAIDIDDSTTIIGGCDQSDNPNNDQMFVWSQGVMANLNDLVQDNRDVNIRSVSAINNSGQITAKALDEFGDVVAVVLTPVEGPLGDLNADCTVGAADLLFLLVNWGSCANCQDCAADFDSDCNVGASDLLILLGNWG